MKAIIIGATGATGKVLLQQLLADEAYSQITIFVRKPTELSHPKLQEEVIDFNQPKQWCEKVQGDVLFSCLGTTIKAAGSQDEQWKIDYDYQYQFAQAARENGVLRYVLVSSFGTNAKSKSFYIRMKGQLDEAVQQLGFPYCVVVRPPILECPNTDCTGEKISLAIIKGLNAIGLLKKLTPIPVATLANVMRQAVKFEVSFAIWESGGEFNRKLPTKSYF